MTQQRESDRRRPLLAAIFDVDGVIADTPHERAWREALAGFAEPRELTTTLYQSEVAGKPRLAGARAALEQLGVADASRLAPLYAEQKQRRFLELIEAGESAAFPDAIRFIRALKVRGYRLAVASSSKNATAIMRFIRVEAERQLLDFFDADLCGRDVRRGKPDPEIFLLAAAQLALAPERCFVVEDAAAGIEAAKAGHMMALGVARVGDADLLRAAGADLVVTSLDEVVVDALVGGRLTARPS